MAALMAIVSKAVFEKAYGSAVEVGTVLPIDRYDSQHAALDALTEGGDLYLVTARPGGVLWLVGVLRGPARKRGRWTAAPNTVPVLDASAILSQLRFANGKGLKAEAGRLGMALQTPHILAESDVAVLEGLIAPAGKTTAQSKTAPAAKTVAASPATWQRSNAEIGTPWATTVPTRPDGVPEDAAFDAIDRRWVAGTRAPDGVRSGAWREWREDGTLFISLSYVGGLTHGSQTEYHPDGSCKANIRWVHGVQKETTFFRQKRGESECTFFDGVSPRVVAIVSVPDEEGFGWRTGRPLDASGVELTAAGERVPERPSGVPPAARYAPTDPSTPSVPARWVDGTTEYTTHAKLGLHRVWSESGAILRTTEYTRRGRQIWTREALGEDPRDTALEAFFATPQTFDSKYKLGQLWTPELHERVRARLREVGTAHVAEYLEILAERVEWHLAELAWPKGLQALGLEIVHDWLERAPTDTGKKPRPDPDAGRIYHWALTSLLDLHDRETIRAMWPRAKPCLDKEDSYHTEVGEKAKALVDGSADRALDRLRAKLGKDRGAATGEELLAVARRELRVPDLSILLGSPTEGEVLLIDACGRAYLFDGASFAPAPLAIDRSERSHARHFVAYDACDERRLFLSGQHVWWTLLRYGWSLYLQGSQYFSSRGQGELTLAAFVRCPDMAWAKRVTKMFRASMPSAAVEVDPFFVAKKGWLMAWEYRAASWAEPFGLSLSRGVDGDAIVSGGGSPGVLRLEMLEASKKKRVGPKTLERYPSAAEAIDRFDRFETSLFRHGYHLARVVALPMPRKVEAEAPKPKKAAAAPSLVGVAADVTLTLQRAAASGDLRGVLEALREAWEARPATAIADAIDAVSRRAPAAPDLAGKTKAAVTRWDAVEKTRDPSMLGALLSTLTDVPSTVVLPRLERLLTWPVDPRLDQALMNMAWEIPFSSSGTQKVWRRIFKRLAASRDARILARLRELPARYKKAWATTTGAWAREQVGAMIEERSSLLEALSALTLGKDESDHLAKVMGATAAPTAKARDARGEHIARILARPDDLELRRAYAEAFASTGDVRAEHIALSFRGDALDKAGRARLKELELDHIAELAGPLAKHIKKGAKVRHGFVADCAQTGAELSDEVASSPWWSTVERLDAGYDWALLRSPTLLALRALEGVSFSSGDGEDEESFPSLASLPVRPLVRSLGVSVRSGAALGEVIRAEKFPSLEELSFSLPRRVKIDDAWLKEAGSARLSHITIVQEANSTTMLVMPDGSLRNEHDRTSIANLATLWATARTHPTLTAVRAHVTYGSRVTFLLTREASGRGQLSVTANSELYAWWSVLVDNVCALLDVLAPLGCAHVVLQAKVKSVTDFVAPIAEAARLAGMTLDRTKVGKG